MWAVMRTWLDKVFPSNVLFSPITAWHKLIDLLSFSVLFLNKFLIFFCLSYFELIGGGHVSPDGSRCSTFATGSSWAGRTRCAASSCAGWDHSRTARRWAPPATGPLRCTSSHRCLSGRAVVAWATSCARISSSTPATSTTSILVKSSAGSVNYLSDLSPTGVEKMHFHYTMTFL